MQFSYWQSNLPLQDTALRSLLLSETLTSPLPASLSLSPASQPLTNLLLLSPPLHDFLLLAHFLLAFDNTLSKARTPQSGSLKGCMRMSQGREVYDPKGSFKRATLELLMTPRSVLNTA